MTNVGEVIGPRTPRPWAMPCVRVVLPAPRPPVSTTRSPALSRAPSLAPQAWASPTPRRPTRRDPAIAPEASVVIERPSGGTAATCERLQPPSLGQVRNRPPYPRLVTRVEVDGCGTFGTPDERQELLADDVAVLQHDDVTGVVDKHVLGARNQPHDLLAVLRGCQHVLDSVDHQRLDPNEMGQCLALVMAVESLHEVGDDLDTGLEDHVRRQLHDAQGHRRGERVEVNEVLLDLTAGLEHRVDQPLASGELPNRQWPQPVHRLAQHLAQPPRDR